MILHRAILHRDSASRESASREFASSVDVAGINHGQICRTRREIDGLWFTPDVIEHGLLRGNRRPPFGLRRVLRAGDPRLAHASSVADPRVHFALKVVGPNLAGAPPGH